MALTIDQLLEIISSWINNLLLKEHFHIGILFIKSKYNNIVFPLNYVDIQNTCKSQTHQYDWKMSKTNIKSHPFRNRSKLNRNQSSDQARMAFKNTRITWKLKKKKSNISKVWVIKRYIFAQILSFPHYFAP